MDGKITYHLFSQVDNVEHARLKRPIVRHYSVPSVLALEKHMDKVINDLCGHLEKRFIDQNKTCDFGAWLAYCESSFPPGDLISTIANSCRCVGLYQRRDLQQAFRIHGEGLRF